jgi:tRNA dimethylallyltransferase
MLYFKALWDGLHDMPPADMSVRAALNAEAAARGWPAMHAELAKVDPPTAARLAPADAQRIQRALEVWRVAGKPMSHFHAQRQRQALAQPPQGIALFSLEPQDRAWLHRRIAQRFEAMLEHGFVDEVRHLRARGDLRADMPSMRCVGYRQAWEVLDMLAEDASAKGALAQDAALLLRERGVAATRQLAKRQMTWLRSMTQRRIVPCDAPDAQPRMLRLLEQAVNQR